MKPPLGSFVILAATVFALAGCDPENQQHPQQQPGKRPGFNNPNRQPPHDAVLPPDGGGETPSDTPPEHRDRPPQSPDPTTTRPTTPPPATGNPEYGKAVPGKPGFVTSPYAPYQGYVDVRGYAPGTEVKDPYTGKIFLVPAQ